VNALRIGSLCTGYGGLDGAVQAVLGGELAWVADPDPGAAAILAHHHPDIPNLGDITKTNWEDVARVDLLCGGYPCQPFSDAGLRLGVEDERHIWPYFATAIRVLRPSYVVLENVRGHLGRGFDVVLGDLAALGFDAEWQLVRASDVDAPHRRERLFVVATAADAEDNGHERGRLARGRWAGPADGGVAAADAASDGRHEGRPEPARLIGRPDAALSSTPAPANADRAGSETCGGRPGARDKRRHESMGDSDADWGVYTPAIRRWEHVTGRPAPRPTEPGRTGERLAPVFVEWLMGLPAGHVTDVPGLSRNAQLKALGNGVVPQQAIAALQILLERRAAA
jgi:DNA (cytosine-5)-methyltransferase 1